MLRCVRHPFGMVFFKECRSLNVTIYFSNSLKMKKTKISGALYCLFRRNTWFANLIIVIIDQLKDIYFEK